MIDLSTIIVSFNTAHLLQKAVTKLRVSARTLSHEIIFVDNASSDGSAEFIKQSFPDDQLIANTVNVGFGRANNQALPFARGKFVLLLNTDAFVAPDTLTKTLAYMNANPRCGILGVRLEGRDGELQPCARYFPNPWNLFLVRAGLSVLLSSVCYVDDMAWDHRTVRHCDWVVGCYYLVRRELIDQIGLFDPRYFLYYEEVDHCFAARQAGWEVVFYPYSTVVHLGGESAKTSGAVTKAGRQLSALQIESELLFMRKNYGRLGFFTHVALSFLADFILMIRSLFKANVAASSHNLWLHICLVYSLVRKTRLGVVPTQ